jgi:hypothetical protein
VIHAGKATISSAFAVQLAQIADIRSVGADPAAKTKNIHRIEHSSKIEIAKHKQLLSILLSAKTRPEAARIFCCMDCCLNLKAVTNVREKNSGPRQTFQKMWSQVWFGRRQSANRPALEPKLLQCIRSTHTIEGTSCALCCFG